METRTGGTPVPLARPVRAADPTKFTDEERAAGYRLLESLVARQREEGRTEEEALERSAREAEGPLKDELCRILAARREHTKKRAEVDRMLRARHAAREAARSKQEQARPP